MGVSLQAPVRAGTDMPISSQKREKACFLTKTSLFAYPLVEISGIEPLTS